MKPILVCAEKQRSHSGYVWLLILLASTQALVAIPPVLEDLKEAEMATSLTKDQLAYNEVPGAEGLQKTNEFVIVSGNIAEVETNLTNDQLEYNENLVAEGLQETDEFVIVSGNIVVIENHNGTSLIVKNKKKEWTSFKWYHNDAMINTSNYIHQKGGLNGTYQVIATNKKGKETRSQRYYHNTPSRKSTVSLSYYPVPISAGDDLNIFYNDKANDNPCECLKIYDLKGKLVYNTKIKTGIKEAINTSLFSPGVYTIKTHQTSSKLTIQ